MGIMKSYHTALYSTRFERGTHGAASRVSLKKKAVEAEVWIQKEIRMTLATEAEWRAWVWKCSSRRLKNCTACPLSRRGGDVVLGSGPWEPLLTIVGGVPGESESERGLPWVDDQGAVLRKVCYKLGINLARDVWLTHSVACETPYSRLPDKVERQACENRLKEELGVVRPPVLLLLGVAGMKLLSIGRGHDLADLRGLVPKKYWPRLGDGSSNLKAVFLSHHPGVLLKTSRVEKKRLLGELAQDLRKVKRVMDLLDRRRA